MYAQEFTHKGEKYKIPLQNRVNPDQSNGHLKIIPASETGVGADYWLSPNHSDVHPYGILIRHLKADSEEPVETDNEEPVEAESEERAEHYCRLV